MDARLLGAAPHPLLALGMIPQRARHLPALPVIGRAEQAARQRSTPEDAGLVGAAGRERPDARGAPVDRPAPHVVLLVAVRLGRVSGGRHLLPAVRGRAVELDAEMAVIERRIGPPVPTVGQREGDVVTQEIDGCDLPLPGPARHREQAFTRRNEKLVAHHQPPDSAWKTWIVLRSFTGSARRARSRIIRPSTKIVMCLRKADWRSEEHTSELQSQSNLV